MPVPVIRMPLRLTPDSSRVITRFFNPGDLKRSRQIIERVLSFPEREIEERLAELERTFRTSHPDLRDVFEANFRQMENAVPVELNLNQAQRLFLGACFTMEYAIESVALFNPSIVPAFIQDDVPPGGIRFLMSLRATGEGHLSSIVFRTGIIDAAGDVELDALPAIKPDAQGHSARPVSQSQCTGATWWRSESRKRISQPILDRLGDQFHARSTLRSDRGGTSDTRVIGLAGIDRRLLDLADPCQLPASACHMRRSAHKPRS